LAPFGIGAVWDWRRLGLAPFGIGALWNLPPFRSCALAPFRFQSYAREYWTRQFGERPGYQRLPDRPRR
jgi:hypothetical protein